MSIGTFVAPTGTGNMGQLRIASLFWLEHAVPTEVGGERGKKIPCQTAPSVTALYGRVRGRFARRGRKNRTKQYTAGAARVQNAK